MTAFRDDVLEQAAEWFARRRRGVMTLEERANYETWSHQPGNSAAMAELEHVWELTNQAHVPAHPETEEPVRRSANLARSAVLAILCVATLGVGMISYTEHSDFWTRLDWVER